MKTFVTNDYKAAKEQPNARDEKQKGKRKHLEPRLAERSKERVKYPHRISGSVEEADKRPIDAIRNQQTRSRRSASSQIGEAKPNLQYKFPKMPTSCGRGKRERKRNISHRQSRNTYVGR